MTTNSRWLAKAEQAADRATIEHQAAEIERLRAILAPFIDAANDAEGYPDSARIGADPCAPLATLCVGDLRLAQKLFNAT